jgi:hypothetical protein
MDVIARALTCVALEEGVNRAKIRIGGEQRISPAGGV